MEKSIKTPKSNDRKNGNNKKKEAKWWMPTADERNQTIRLLSAAYANPFNPFSPPEDVGSEAAKQKNGAKSPKKQGLKSRIKSFI